MKNSKQAYYLYRTRLEKLKHKIWQAIVFAKLLAILGWVLDHYC